MEIEDVKLFNNERYDAEWLRELRELFAPFDWRISGLVEIRLAIDVMQQEVESAQDCPEKWRAVAMLDQAESHFKESVSSCL